MGKIYTEKGGLIETSHVRDRIYGDKCVLHVDQSSSVDNRNDDATLYLTNDEIKETIALLNDYLVYTEGKPYVVLAAPLLHPSVKIIVENQEVERIPSLINQYLDIEDITSPGESFIDGEDYLRSIFKQEE